MKFRQLAVSFVLAMCLMVPGSISAEDPKTIVSMADPDIKAAIAADFEGYKGSLKHAFDSSVETAINIAKLENGVPYWTVGSDGELNFSGYIFNILAAGKPSGIIFAENSGGQWQISSIKNNLSFATDLAKSRELVGSKAITRLIYDQQYGIYALGVKWENGEQTVLPLKDHPLIGLTQGEQVTITEFNKIVSRLQQEYGKSADNNG
ncbi:hypothetical protein DNH61_05575 [Paenibacillus sambharensis]|uniref:Uncharacterized protein n=1 Tax=Paenibacillus sambharensis TaxID=1803190 RepID=A0A2W1LCX4_9BACL|nr:hypothetical protein [Paenibacillus sambharensis]PZD96673.1 hypothetical protein DNH61_05575 [Paenibacillus sambharensis]